MVPLEFSDGLAAAERGDYETALSVFRPLAEQGEAEAQHNLGVMFHEGQGVPQDDAEATRWYRLAAEQDDAEAQYNLGVIYANGHGVPQDDAAAMQWYRKAAARGYVEGQYNLGVMYANGQGVPRDDVRAHMWFGLAAAQGHETGAENLVSLACGMSPSAVSRAQRLARAWEEKHGKAMPATKPAEPEVAARSGFLAKLRRALGKG